MLFNANRFRFGGAAIELNVIMVILGNLVVVVTLRKQLVLGELDS